MPSDDNKLVLMSITKQEDLSLEPEMDAMLEYLRQNGYAKGSLTRRGWDRYCSFIQGSHLWPFHYMQDVVKVKGYRVEGKVLSCFKLPGTDEWRVNMLIMPQQFIHIFRQDQLAAAD